HTKTRAMRGWRTIPALKGYRVALMYPKKPAPQLTVSMKSPAGCQRPGLEQLGSWDPLVNTHGEQLVGVDIGRLMHWMAHGARPSLGVARLFGLAGVLPIHPSSELEALRLGRRLSAAASKQPVVIAHSVTIGSHGQAEVPRMQGHQVHQSQSEDDGERVRPRAMRELRRHSVLARQRRLPAVQNSSAQGPVPLPDVEKELDIRKRLMKDLNLSEDNFSSLAEYNNYLEFVESAVFNLANEIDVEATKRSVEEFKKAHADAIKSNRLRRRPELAALDNVIESEASGSGRSNGVETAAAAAAAGT
uniref:MAT1 domain-containing protein n=1 Tax=Macrostomum lignano TaxID=282301 RepID=A0A1I8ILI5_9PLAT